MVEIYRCFMYDVTRLMYTRIKVPIQSNSDELIGKFLRQFYCRCISHHSKNIQKVLSYLMTLHQLNYSN